MPSSLMPACLQAFSTAATCWNWPWASPRTRTPRFRCSAAGGGQPGGQFVQRDRFLSSVIVPSR